MQESYIVNVVGKDLFPNRMHVEKEFGEFLYEQLIFVLESIGEEVDSGRPDLRLGVYLDSNNEGSRKFQVNRSQFEGIWNLFGHKFYEQIKGFSKREQKKGTDVLFQLNNGNISMNDFNKNLE